MGIDGAIIAWLADPVTAEDRKVLLLGSEPSSKDQQAAEALAILVALRQWAPLWLDQRVRLQLRTDNVAALTTLIKMQPHSNALGIIARELALDVAASAYQPDEAIHIPGIANKAADILSRRFVPGTPPPLPPYLDARREHVCALRNEGWWLALPR